MFHFALPEGATTPMLRGALMVHGESVAMENTLADVLTIPALPAGVYLSEVRADGVCVLYGHVEVLPSPLSGDAGLATYRVDVDNTTDVLVVNVTLSDDAAMCAQAVTKATQAAELAGGSEVAAALSATAAAASQSKAESAAGAAMDSAAAANARAAEAAAAVKEADARMVAAQDAAAAAEDERETAAAEAEAAGASAAAAAGAAADAAARAADAATSSQVAAGAASDALEARTAAGRAAESADARMVAAQDAAADAVAAREGADAAATQALAGAAGAADAARTAAESASAAAESAAAIEGANDTITNHDAHWAAWYRQQTDLTGFFEGSTDKYVLTEFKYDLPNLVTGTHLFYHNSTLVKFSGSLQSLVKGPQMFRGCSRLKEFATDSLDKLTSAAEFLYGTKIEEFNYNLPAITSLWKSFGWTTSLRAFRCGELSLLTSATETFAGARSLEIFDGTLPALSSATRMFSDCKLNKESALRVLGSIPVYESGSHPITIGIHVDNKADEEVLAAIDAATAKGWTVTTQWNGTATASTFALRPAPLPPVYVKREQDGCGEYEDESGTRYTVDWGHSVTSPHGEPEALGYELFESVEEALEGWGLEAYVPAESGQTME